MKICKYCGSKIANNKSVCPSCGKRVEEGRIIEKETPKENQKKTSFPWVWILLFLAMIGFSFLFIQLFPFLFLLGFILFILSLIKRK